MDFISGVSELENALRHMAFEHCPEGIILINPADNLIDDVNVAACQLLGYERQQLLHKTASSIFGLHGQLPRFVVFSQQVIEQGQAWSDQLIVFNQDGAAITLEVSASYIKHKNKPHLIILLRDLIKAEINSKHASTERTMRAGLLEWRSILELFENSGDSNQLLLSAVGDGIYSIDRNGLATYINPVGARMLGWEPADVIGKNIHKIHHHTYADGKYYPVEQCPIYAAVRDGVIHEGRQEVFWHRNGQSFPVEFTSTPVISNGNIIGAVVVFRDISERQQTEMRLQQALNELQQLKTRLEEQNAYLQEEILIEHQYHEIVGQSEPIKKIARQIDVVAPTEANVIIYGESGTGKELIARAIHHASKRHEQPLIRVNCAAIPAELFESEFFGHVKGAFTGAVRDRTGRFELADGGTLFLDEIGEIPLELQSKLLRVLQEGQFERVGEEQTRQVNVRVIAATNRDLEEEIKAGRFREDLYFRLNVFPIHSPALCERKGDIPLLAQHFMNSICERLNTAKKQLSQANMQRLQGYHWPGNIRELQNVIERAIITAQGAQLNFEALNYTPLRPGKNQHTGQELAVNQSGDKVLTEAEFMELEKNNLQKALQQTAHKIFGKDGAAELLGVKPTTLISRLKKLGINYKL